MTDRLTPDDFDALIAQPRILWTLPLIARRMNASVDFVRTLTEMPGAPVRKLGGRWFALEDELIEYMRQRCKTP